MAGGFLETPLETMRHVLFSKFWTNLLIARFTAPLIRDGGSMVFTSGSGVRAQAAASYVANQALAAIAQELGSKFGPRVRVNVVAPAFMDTALWRTKPPADVEARIRAGASRNAGEVSSALHLLDGQCLHDRPGPADRRPHDAAETAVAARTETKGGRSCLNRNMSTS
jgi:NAD(P)-dependent dehydrogenase (short-subunit alcohol dehydrogenase family)